MFAELQTYEVCSTAPTLALRKILQLTRYSIVNRNMEVIVHLCHFLSEGYQLQVNDIIHWTFGGCSGILTSHFFIDELFCRVE